MELLSSLVVQEKLEPCLYVVATPIGNRGDITLRALHILRSVDIVAAEDTRNTRRLLDSYGISARLISCHDNNERQKFEQIRDYIDDNQSVALVSDAGTPLISDPGYGLVSQLRRYDYAVKCIPGACALVSALSIAGLPTDRFCFEGFLPARQSGREARLTTLVDESRTLVFYEAPHRIEAFLGSIENVFGADRKVVIARELTKKFETVLSGVVCELMAVLAGDTNQQKGEFVVVVEGVAGKSEGIQPAAKSLLEQLLPYMPLKVAAGIVAGEYGGSKKQYYQLGLDLAER